MFKAWKPKLFVTKVFICFRLVWIKSKQRRKISLKQVDSLIMLFNLLYLLFALFYWCWYFSVSRMLCFSLLVCMKLQIINHHNVIHEIFLLSSVSPQPLGCNSSLQFINYIYFSSFPSKLSTRGNILNIMNWLLLDLILLANLLILLIISFSNWSVLKSTMNNNVIRVIV